MLVKGDDLHELEKKSGLLFAEQIHFLPFYLLQRYFALLSVLESVRIIPAPRMLNQEMHAAPADKHLKESESQPYLF